MIKLISHRKLSQLKLQIIIINTNSTRFEKKQINRIIQFNNNKKWMKLAALKLKIKKNYSNNKNKDSSYFLQIIFIMKIIRNKTIKTNKTKIKITKTKINNKGPLFLYNK